MADNFQFAVMTDLGNQIPTLVVQSISSDEKANVGSVKNETGKVVAKHCHSIDYSKTIETVINGEVTTHAGKKFTIGTKDFMVDSVSIKESNSGEANSATISISTSDNASIIEYDESDSTGA